MMNNAQVNAQQQPQQPQQPQQRLSPNAQPYPYGYYQHPYANISANRQPINMQAPLAPNSPNSPIAPRSAQGARAAHRPSRKLLVIGGASALLVVVALSLVFASLGGGYNGRPGVLTFGPEEMISGVAYGEQLAQREQGYTKLAPLANAKVTCAGASATTDAHGAYSLRVLVASSYHCVVNGGADYQPISAQVKGHLFMPLTLDFTGASVGATPTCASQEDNFPCDSLALTPGSLHGVVTNTAGHIVANAQVRCWVDDAALVNSQQAAAMYTATTNATGAYTLKNLPPDHYACVGADAGNLSRVMTQPAQTATLNLTTCQGNCRGVTYHNGAVLHTMVAYLDFWLPAGKHYEADGLHSSDVRYEQLIEQYFNDLEGTAFYNLLTQYWDAQGPVRNNVRLGGVTFDTTNYPHAGTILDPLGDGDVQSAAARAASQAHWNLNDQPAEVFVFTGYNIQECANTLQCSYNTYCAYHSITSSNMLYGYMPDTCGSSIQQSVQERVYPYNDPIADAMINVLSHEQFETVTDPDTRTASGWHKDQGEGEIGDLCAWKFGPTNAQGGTVTLAHGHSYIVQYEWSNAASGCVYQ